MKWSGDRREAFHDHAARATSIDSELALDDRAAFVGLRATVSNPAPATASFVPLTKAPADDSASTACWRWRACGMLSNTQSTAPYRSAGRPEVVRDRAG